MNAAIWNREETLAPEAMRTLQLERLKATLARAYENVPFYARRMQAAGLVPESVERLEDLARLPFVTKTDLRDQYPKGLFAVPDREVVRIHASSGTTGKPVVAGYTRNDLENWTECVARIVRMAGVSDGDVAQVAFGYGLFTGGFGLHYGLERVGCTVIPASSGNSERQVLLMQDLGTTVLVSTPSYALHLAEILEDSGVNRDTLRLRVGLFGGEGHTEAMKHEIESRLGILDTQNYGLTEIVGPGVSGECLEACGLHINEDHFYPEIIDPDTGEVLPDGQEGELVLTTLTKEALPMLRYRTRDITRLYREPCRCGRTTVRMATVRGRTDDMLIIRGVNVFPSQIESVLVGIEGIGPHYLIIVTSEHYMDKLEVQVELVDGSLLERYSELERLTAHIRHQLRTVLQIDAKVTLLNPKTLERTTGKSKRVLDLRNR